MKRSELRPDDERMLHRWLDGELHGESFAECQQRLAAEPLLREYLQQLQALRACFQPGRQQPVLAPAGFTADLLLAVRQQTLDQTFRRDDEVAVMGLCRRLLLAAAVLMGLAALWHSGVFRQQSPAHLEAAPDEIQKEMQLLDQSVGELRAK